MFSNLREDWVTYGRQWDQRGFWVMVVYRFGRWRYGLRPRLLRMPFSFLYRILKVLSEILTGVELPCETIVGRRLKIEHFGNIIISGDAVIGDDVLLRNGVTVGLRYTGVRGSPIIGDRVDIGCGAKLLGPIRIGNDVVIGANAVVITNVQSDSVATGMPARSKRRRRLDSNSRANILMKG